LKIKKLKEDGFYIIIWTCRDNDDILLLKEWFEKHKIPYDKLNEHHPANIAKHKNNTRKIYADLYVDDRDVNGLPNNWSDIYQLIKRRSSELAHKCLNYASKDDSN